MPSGDQVFRDVSLWEAFHIQVTGQDSPFKGVLPMA